MKGFPLLSMSGELIGHIKLLDDVSDTIGSLHPKLELGYSYNLVDPKEILSFILVYVPATPSEPSVASPFTRKSGEPICGASRISGWGSRQTCVFKKDHPVGQHSWTVT